MSDVNSIVEQIKTAVGDILKTTAEIGKDSIDQLEGIARQTELIGKGMLIGDLTKEEGKEEFENVKEISKNFVNTLVGLVAITIEKIWNTIVKILSGVIQSIAGIILL
jgi:hypothetical protein